MPTYMAGLRVFLRKGEGLVAPLVNSAFLPEGEALFAIVVDGIADPQALDRAVVMTIVPSQLNLEL